MAAMVMAENVNFADGHDGLFNADKAKAEFAKAKTAFRSRRGEIPNPFGYSSRSNKQSGILLVSNPSNRQLKKRLEKKRSH